MKAIPLHGTYQKCYSDKKAQLIRIDCEAEENLNNDPAKPIDKIETIVDCYASDDSDRGICSLYKCIQMGFRQYNNDDKAK